MNTQNHEEDKNDPRRFLYGWIFQWNPFRQLYECTNRDNYFKLFNGGDRTPILESSRIDSIQSVIMKCEGRMDKIIEFKKNMEEVK